MALLRSRVSLQPGSSLEVTSPLATSLLDTKHEHAHTHRVSFLHYRHNRKFICSVIGMIESRRGNSDGNGNKCKLDVNNLFDPRSENSSRNHAMSGALRCCPSVESISPLLLTPASCLSSRAHKRVGFGRAFVQYRPRHASPCAVCVSVRPCRPSLALTAVRRTKGCDVWVSCELFHCQAVVIRRTLTLASAVSLQTVGVGLPGHR